MQESYISKSKRGLVKNQKPFLVWFTGISGAGKSTVASLTLKKISELGKHAYLIDGDVIRLGLCKDLGYDEESRVENIRRAAHVAALMMDAGLIVLAAFISPFRSERNMARSLVGQDSFLEVFMDTPLWIAEKRDPKGLYKKARSGEIKNFTGLDSPYEAPENPEIRLVAGEASPEEMADVVVSKIIEMQIKRLKSKVF